MSAEVTQQNHPRPAPALVTSYVDHEAVLFDPRTRSVLHLNPAASAVWMLLDGTQSTEAIASELAAIFGKPVNVIRPDVDAAVADFESWGLLARSDSETFVDLRSTSASGDAARSTGRPPLAELSQIPRPPEPCRCTNPFSDWAGQLNMRAGVFVVGVEYDSAKTRDAIFAECQEWLAETEGLQQLDTVPAAFGVRTAAVGLRRRRVGLVHHGANVRYRVESLDAAVRTLRQIVGDIATIEPGAIVAPFQVYERNRSAVLVDAVSPIEINLRLLRKVGVTEVPCWAPSIDADAGTVTAGGRTYPIVGIIEPWLPPGTELDDVRRMVASRVAGDRRAVALVVDGLGDRVMAASIENGDQDVTHALRTLLASS